MKIFIFINSLAGGGAERVTATLANYWARAQWDVTIVTLAPQSEDFYALDPAVKRIAMDMAGDSANVLDGLLQNFRRVFALRKLIRQHRPDAVMAMMSTPNVLLAFASWGISSICAVGSERCYPPHFPLAKMWHVLRQRMYGRLHAVVALTQESAKWIKSHSNARHIPVIPNPVVWPMPNNAPRIDPGKLCDPEKKVLLAVGRLSREKGFGILINAFSKLAARHDDWNLVILGEGPERAGLQKQIDESALGSKVLMPGIAGNVGEWYSRADLFAMSSLYEGFPNALAEALAHGLPAVSFDCDTGPRDIIRHEVDGLLVSLGSEAELLGALDRLMKDGDARAALAARASDARERFSIEKVARMWEQLFIEGRTAARLGTDGRPAPAAREGVSS
ncbi:glycosyltransferase involved in cell wall biosynthesis [Paucimonas lemoignei]|uniref:Glycosyltransferase involved in cell wall biosynthesis n=1 Tax=Paucimonas lemoignei TaxID=29443 RepID=A0A4R3HQN7_PAULE|nr:glycosyltransferase family 4 protein [Paucimonas lemoignei]TCS34319.1 glycosyltransferase involved in cell wall biosynthesis [Paucimonas lemoignei]